MNYANDDEDYFYVSAGCHINDVMNTGRFGLRQKRVSAGCHINDVMNRGTVGLR